MIMGLGQREVIMAHRGFVINIGIQNERVDHHSGRSSSRAHAKAHL